MQYLGIMGLGIMGLGIMGGSHCVLFKRKSFINNRYIVVQYHLIIRTSKSVPN